MFEIGTQLWISRSHGYLEVCSKSPKVRDTDILLYMLLKERWFYIYRNYLKSIEVDFAHS